MKTMLIALTLLAAAAPLHAKEVEIITSNDGTKYAFLPNTPHMGSNGVASVVVSVNNPKRKTVDRTKLMVQGCASKGGLYYIENDQRRNYWTWNEDDAGTVIDKLATVLCRVLETND